MGDAIVSIGTADVYPAFAAGVAAEYGPVMHEKDGCPVTRRRDGGGKPSGAPANHAQINIVIFFRKNIMGLHQLTPFTIFLSTGILNNWSV